MSDGSFASWMLSQEARSLLTRLERIKSFAMSETMVPAATLSVEAQAAVERYLIKGRRELRTQIHQYISWVEGPEGRRATPAEAHRRFTFLRLRFNVVLSHFDIFSEALSQRSEAENGVWLAGMDVLSKDALALPGYYEVPPVICYLARGPGAAIRRARTRLPGGGENPAAIIRVPRERMIGSSLASSLFHEVGHQGAALLGLVASLRAALREVSHEGTGDAVAWGLWERWISEIVADFWSVARVGVTSTVGLMGVVSLPRAFVFRLNMEDPHPIPYIRVKLSSALGGLLYPHPQWARLSRLWEEFYPLEGLSEQHRQVLAALEASLPRFARLLVEHRPPSLRGRTLVEVMGTRMRQPARLGEHYREWRSRRSRIREAPPSLVFAVIGQARTDGAISPEEESKALAELLKYWALRSTLDASETCATLSKSQALASVLRVPALPRNSVT
ncbi:hypothetical protein [Corallococcus carmarthensis]|uniref:hypothetical protein n=1 Tax=Corallococcus carmarthensis TaxID=2316728 RepID=UPI00148CC0EA|nr:hypothetical protein [Corallococcus carmarthensis]NOK15734.1 hypothetical protein [Corallococcus carmarthensis]